MAEYMHASALPHFVAHAAAQPRNAYLLDGNMTGRVGERIQERMQSHQQLEQFGLDVCFRYPI